MTRWSDEYERNLKQLSQEPVYVMLLCRSVDVLSDTAGAAPNISATTILVDDDHDVDARPEDPIIMWDKDYFEMAEVLSLGSGGGEHIITVKQRGDYGTYPRAFARSASIAVVNGVFSTSAVNGLTTTYHQLAEFPSGGGVSIDRRNGRTKADPVQISVQDREQIVTKLLTGSPLIGEWAMVFAGYKGMVWRDYSLMYSGRIKVADIREGQVYDFTIDPVIDRMAVKIFRHIKDYNDVGYTNGLGTQTVGSGTLQLDETKIPTSGNQHQTDAAPYYAAYHLKVQSEWERVTQATGIADPSVARGALETTAAEHTQGQTLTMAFVIEDNPIDILLGLLLSRGANVQESNSDDGTYDYAWGEMTDAAFDDIGIGYPEVEVNVESFEAIRDIFFVDYVWRLIFKKGENIRPFIEKHLLMPLNLNIAPDRTGRLALSYVRPPHADIDSIEILTTDDIIGVPTLTLDHADLINDVTIEYDWDHDTEAYTTTTRVLDETSIVNHGTKGIVEMQARGLVAVHNSAVLGPRLARKKRKHMDNPAPLIPLDVLYTRAGIEVGKYVIVTHPGIIDFRRGVRGVTANPMQVVGRFPNWRQGTLRLEVIDPGYYGSRWGNISPSGTVDYTSASDIIKARYAFVSGATSEQMSDGTDGYLVS
jgi:hypothetical protein